MIANRISQIGEPLCRVIEQPIKTHDRRSGCHTRCFQQAACDGVIHWFQDEENRTNLFFKPDRALSESSFGPTSSPLVPLIDTSSCFCQGLIRTLANHMPALPPVSVIACRANVAATSHLASPARAIRSQANSLRRSGFAARSLAQTVLHFICRNSAITCDQFIAQPFENS